MHKLFRLLLPIVFLIGLLLPEMLAQQLQHSSVVFTTSGTSQYIENPGGNVTVAFEEKMTGSPSTVSIGLQGCMTGGTCSTLDTYTTTSNAIRTPTVTVAYDYYYVTVSWTGGTNVTVTVNATLSPFASNTGGGGGAFGNGAGAGYQDAAEISIPSDPASGYDRLYFNTSHQLACLTPSAGNCLAVSASAGGSNGQGQYNSSGALAGWTAGGDCTIVFTTGVVTCTKSNGTAFGSAAFDTGPAGAILGTTDIQTETNKTVDGVTPTTFGYVDPTSSIQTQLNSKQATLTGTGLARNTGASSEISGDCATSGSNAIVCTKTNGTLFGTGATATIANYLLLAGGTMTGELITHLSATSGAGFNLPHGAPPTAPVNGDCWTTTSGLFCYINGATVGPFGTGSGGMVYPGAGIPNSAGSSWGTSFTEFGSQAGVATSADPGTTVNVPMVADGSHGQKPSTSGALGTGAFATIANYVPTSTTVNGHALSANVTVAPGDLAAGALANGMTATTQSVADNTTKVATDAFVLANAVTNPMTTLGDVIDGGPSGVATRVPGPTTPNGVPQYLVDIPAAGASVAEAWALSGVPVDATSPSTLLVTDRANYVKWASGTALALPAVATTFASNLPFVIQNLEGATLTITPNAAASDLIDGAATASLLNKFAAFVYQDGTTAPGHWFTVNFPTFAAFGSTCTNGLTWSTTTGIACQTAAPVANTTTVNGHALSSNVTVSASDLTTGTLATAQAPIINVDAQTGSYSPSTCTTDGKGEIEFNISAVATLTLPSAASGTCGNNVWFVVRNTASSTAVLTVTATTSLFEPEAVSSHTILPSAGLFVYSDGTNYHALEAPASFGGVTSKTGAYTATAADRNKLITFNCSTACALTLPATPPTSSWNITVLSFGSTLATVSLNSLNFNGAGTAPTLSTGHISRVYTDGSNYFGDISSSGGSGSSSNIIYCTGSASATAATCAGVPSGATTYTAMTGYFIAGANSTGAPLTVNVNSLGAKNVYLNGAATSATNQVLNGAIYSFYYDGTEIQLTAPQPASNAAWAWGAGYGKSSALTMATVNHVYVWAVPTGPYTAQNLSYFDFLVDTTDATGTDYYDIGIYGPCAPSGVSCPLVADLANGTHGINFTSSTSGIDAAIHQSHPTTLLAPGAGQWYYVAFTGNATTSSIWGQQSVLIPVCYADLGSGAVTASGQLAATITVPAASWSDCLVPEGAAHP